MLDIIKDAVENHLVGFEIVSYSENSCILESITEPDVDNFNTLVNKQFFIIKEIFELLNQNLKKKNKERTKQIKQLALNVHKHSNFLRRCISKRIFPTRLSPFYWTFLSFLTLAARKSQFLNNYISKRKVKPNPDINKLLDGVKEITEKLHKLYRTKDLELVQEIHTMENKFASNFGIKALNSKKNDEKVVIHYLINIVRMLYHSSSAMVTIIKH